MANNVLGISRSISACKRCRQKKIKCSHEFPKCAACLKAKVECVSLDAATGREIPRSYIVYLENRIAELEEILQNRGDHRSNSANATNHASIKLESDDQSPFQSESRENSDSVIMNTMKNYNPSNKRDDSSRPATFAGDGISFSKLMSAAVHFKNDNGQTFKERRRSSGAANHSHPYIKPPIDPTTTSLSSFTNNIALLPPKQQALDFIALYFAQSNAQLPIFHRQEFFKNYFIPIYGEVPPSSSFASTHTEIDWSSLPKVPEDKTWYHQYARLLDEETGRNPNMDPFKFAAKVAVPKEFRKPLYFINIVFAIASSVWHLQFPGEISENFKNAALVHIEDAYSSLDRLEALQAMLCLTLFSLMRPCVPGVWYLLGSSLRLCVDLGLHNESQLTGDITPFHLDMRRRLFWCCYSLDRQICVYLGRPFGIPEESIKVEFPSMQDDQFINLDSTMSSLYSEPQNQQIPSYKNVALGMFQIRRLKAEVQSILYETKELPRRFNSLNEWFDDINLRLDDWKEHIPKTSKIMNCEFTTEFFELNFYHAKIMIYGLSPARYVLSENDMLCAADASRGLLRTFHKLWNRGALNYTWAVTQNIFMAQTSFLYSLFNSEKVKETTSSKEVQKYANYAYKILKSLDDKCTAAGQCLEVLTILCRAVLKLKYPQFEPKEPLGTQQTESSSDMDRLPSEQEIKNFQAGGHMTGKARRLIVSIPQLINSEAGDRKRQKRNNFNGVSGRCANGTPLANTPVSQLAASHITRSESQMSDSSEVIPESLWNVNGFDLEKFFENVRSVQSPANANGINKTQLTRMLSNEGSSNNEMGTSNTISSPFADTSVGQTLPYNISGHPYSNDVELHGYITQGQHHGLPQTHHNLSNSRQNIPHVGLTGTTFYQTNQPSSHNGLMVPSYAPYRVNTASPLYLSSNGTPISIYPNASSVTTPSKALENATQNVADEIKKEDKEGQRVYKMMFETGTESIWDQFFAQPFKLDEL